MRLIRGAPGAGKTAQILREFAAAMREGSRQQLRVVVPTATLVNHLRHELARSGVVFPPSAVLSLNRFCAELAPGVRPVPSALLPAIVRECLEELRPREVSRLLESAGLIATLIDTIGQFETEGITPAQLSNRKLTATGRVFLRLWRAIDQSIHNRGFQTRADLIRAALSAQPRGLTIWMDGFLNLSPLEEELIAGLARTCDVTLTLPDTPAAEHIHRFALSLGARDHLLSGGGRQPECTVVEAPSMEGEAAELARRILDLRAGGTPFRRIGVALRDTAGYLTLLQSTLERFGIPARYYFGHSLATHPIAVFASGLVTGALEGWDHEAALKTFRAHPRYGSSPDFDRFDFKVREAMPGLGMDALLSFCESERLHRDLANCLRIEAWKALLERPAVWQRRIEKLLANQYRPGTLDPPSGHASIAAARSHVAALNACLAALESAVAFFAEPERAVTLADYWRVASSVIANTVFQIPDDRADVVHVMSVHEARQWDLDALLVCGLTDHDFPRREAANLFFPDAALFLDARRGDGDEQALFEALCTRASEALVLTYPTHDAAGKSVERSRFLADIAVPERARPVAPAIPARAMPGRTGCIVDPAKVAELAQLHRSTSMSSLKDLADCRFKFFAHKSLGLKAPPDRPADRLQARLTGTILHKALEVWQKDRTRDFVQLFDEAFAAACIEEHLPPGYRLEVKRLEFREIAASVSATEQWRYDSSEVEVPLEIELSVGVTVSTRIDRLDIIGDDCIIVDYKSGKTSTIKQDLESESHLQGPLYALAARERRGLNPIAVVFWAVRDDERHGWGSIPGAPDSVNASLREMPANWAVEARAAIEQRLVEFFGGNVAVQPRSPAACQWCDFAHVCRVEQQQLIAITAGHNA